MIRRQGEKDEYRGALTFLSFYLHLSANPLHKSIGDRKPQAGSFAWLLGGEERVKEAVPVCLFDPDAIVLDGDLNELISIVITGSC